MRACAAVGLPQLTLLPPPCALQVFSKLATGEMPTMQGILRAVQAATQRRAEN